MNAHEHYQLALALRSRVIAGTWTGSTISGWAAVARNCAIAKNLYRKENENLDGARHASFLDLIDMLEWPARAQVETLARKVGA